MGALTGAMGYLFNELSQRAASTASVVLDAEGGVALLMGGVASYDEALRLNNWLKSSSDQDFIRMFPELYSRSSLEIAIVRQQMISEVTRVGVSGLNSMMRGGVNMTSDVLVGASVAAAAGVVGVSYRTLALIELGLAAGTSSHSRNFRSPLIDDIRSKYVK